ncbi:MAG: hypothetical protein ACJ74Y_05130 [Bryobacteraceae bacterium]
MELKDPFCGVPIASNAPAACEELIGKRVQIRAVKALGSARLLDGLTGTVVALHPIATGWVKLDLDENSRTPHRDWSVAADRLVLVKPEPANVK